MAASTYVTTRSRRRALDEATRANVDAPLGTLPADLVSRHIGASLRCDELRRLAATDKRMAATLRDDVGLCDEATRDRDGWHAALAARYLAGAIIHTMRRSLTHPLEEAMRAHPGRGVSFEQSERLLRSSNVRLYLSTKDATNATRPEIRLRIRPGRDIKMEKDVYEFDEQDGEWDFVGNTVAQRFEFATPPGEASELLDWLFGAILARGVESSRGDKAPRSWLGMSRDDWMRLLDGGASAEGGRFLRLLAVLMRIMPHRFIGFYEIGDADDADRFGVSVPPLVTSFIGAPLALVRGNVIIGVHNGLSWSDQVRKLADVQGARTVPTWEPHELIAGIGRIVWANAQHGYAGVRTRMRRLIADTEPRTRAAMRAWFEPIDAAIVRDAGATSDADRSASLLRAIYGHVDPVRYRRWLDDGERGDERVRGAIDSGAPFSAYLDDVDATWGGGVSTRPLADLLLSASFDDTERQTLGELRTLSENAAAAPRLVRTPTLPYDATAALYAGASARRE